MADVQYDNPLFNAIAYGASFKSGEYCDDERGEQLTTTVDLIGRRIIDPHAHNSTHTTIPPKSVPLENNSATYSLK